MKNEAVAIPLNNFIDTLLRSYSFIVTTRLTGCGFFVAGLSMAAAAIVETQRLRLVPSAGDYYDQAARDNISPCQVRPLIMNGLLARVVSTSTNFRVIWV